MPSDLRHAKAYRSSYEAPTGPLLFENLCSAIIAHWFMTLHFTINYIISDSSEKSFSFPVD